MTAQIILGVLIGMAVCGVAVGFYFIFQMLRNVQRSLDSFTLVTRDLLADGSIVRASKSLTYIAKNADDWMRGIGEFARLMSLVAHQVFDTEKLGETKTTKAAAEESGFFPGVSDTEASEQEAMREAARHGVSLNEEQLKTFRTEGQ